jgi:hypothetical protein
MSVCVRLVTMTYKYGLYITLILVKAQKYASNTMKVSQKKLNVQNGLCYTKRQWLNFKWNQLKEPLVFFFELIGRSDTIISRRVWKGQAYIKKHKSEIRPKCKIIIACKVMKVCEPSSSNLSQSSSHSMDPSCGPGSQPNK